MAGEGAVLSRAFALGLSERCVPTTFSVGELNAGYRIR